MLVFCETEADGTQFGQPRGATVFSSTAADAGQSLGFIARADLSQLDSRAEERCEVADQLSEIDAVFGGEVHGEFLAIPLPLGVGHFHREIVLGDPLANLPAHVFFGLAEFIDEVRFRLGRDPHDPAFGVGCRTAAAVIAANAALLQCCGTDRRYAAEVLPAVHFDDDGIADV